MAFPCWVVLVLGFFLSPESSLAAVEQDWLTNVVQHIRNEYELGDNYSLAVNIPVNQDPGSLTDVFKDDPPDTVKQAVSNGQVYQGTRVVAAAQTSALAHVLEKIEPLIKSSEGNVLIVYSVVFPEANDIESKVNDIIQNCKSYAFVFSKVDAAVDANMFKQQGTSKFGLENIFRCYEPSDSFQCTNCRAGSDVAPSCVADTTQNSGNQDSGSGSDDGGEISGQNVGLGIEPALTLTPNPNGINQIIGEDTYGPGGMTDIMGGQRPRKGRKGKKGKKLKEEGEVGKGGEVQEGGKRGKGGRIRGGNGKNNGRIRKESRRGKSSRVRKGRRRDKTGKMRKGGRRGKGGKMRKGGRRGKSGKMRKGRRREKSGKMRKGGRRGKSRKMRKGRRRDKTGKMRKGGRRGKGGKMRKGGRRGKSGKMRKGGRRRKGGKMRKGGRRGRRGKSRGRKRG